MIVERNRNRPFFEKETFLTKPIKSVIGSEISVIKSKKTK